MSKPFDGYLGHILRLKDGRSVRILGDAGVDLNKEEDDQTV